MKSFGSRFFHQRVTSSLLLKNLCPPMSKRNPPLLTVRAIPPTYSGSFSRTVTSMPASRAPQAAVSPAGPAPTTTTRHDGAEFGICAYLR